MADLAVQVVSAMDVVNAAGESETADLDDTVAVEQKWSGRTA